MVTTNPNSPHIPVLLQEVLKCLQPNSGETYLDLTAGYGGHAGAVLERTLNSKGMTLVDRDHSSVDYLRKQAQFADSEIINRDFLEASKFAQGRHSQYDMILADLGVSSVHLDNADRGFSIKNDGPLDMRMDQSQSMSAETMVNSYTESEIADLIRKYGEDPHSKRIARVIVEQRPFASTGELAEAIASSSPGYSKVHPATRTFQAFRIAVNKELQQVQEALPIWNSLLAPGGRLAVISFHSLEDRIVKDYFKSNSGDRYDATLRLVTKKPKTASANELVLNPRARSAKLRAACKK
ncbi:16S rRNA (cytosine(1402)-N(4))-methyltransferase RsmH [Candidatus Saccharibacteria bacterium]|nr:16S rRNA (cytosine(1402)-N(4))-methyltransferase RsmH [Candidatus Saccharibacteria bacterium]